MKEPEHTKITVVLNYSLSELQKAYARFFGIKNYRTVSKSDISEWVGDLAEGDIDQDMEKALEEHK